MDRIALPVLLVLFLVAGCAKQDASSDVPYYPRMPDAYRNKDYHDKKQGTPNLNPAGFAIYDHAETEAEDEYFGVEVVPLEESQRILEERRKNEQVERASEKE